MKLIMSFLSFLWYYHKNVEIIFAYIILIFRLLQKKNNKIYRKIYKITFYLYLYYYNI